MVIEELFTSKVRVKLLRVFVTDPETPRYLRDLERNLDLPLSPLRRELINLVNKGLLTTKRDANIKYYYVNKRSEMFDKLTEFFRDDTVKPEGKDSAVVLPSKPDETVSTVSNGLIKFVDALLVTIFIIACINIYLVTNLTIKSAGSNIVYYPLHNQEVLMGKDKAVVDAQATGISEENAVTGSGKINRQDKDVVKAVLRNNQISSAPGRMSSSSWRMSFGAWNTGNTIWNSKSSEPRGHEL